MAFVSLKARGASLSGSGIVRCKKMLGLDSSASENGVALTRADGKSFFDGKERPGSINMIRTALGEVSKRAGFCICDPIDGIERIDGVYTFSSGYGELYFFISGQVLTVLNSDNTVFDSVTLPESYYDCTVFGTDSYVYFMNGSCLFIYNAEDKTHMYIHKDGTTDISSPDKVYMPTVFIANTPTGSGSGYEAVNLLTPYVAEQYIGDGSSTEYTLHYEADGNVSAYAKQENGQWTGIAVKSVSGNTVIFETAPSSLVDGEDSVRIVYKRKSFTQNAAKLACCTCAAAFGVGGYKDRVFMSANDAYPGLVFYSEMDKPLYFPDLGYIKVGSVDTRITALAGQDVSLAVICNDNVYTVRGSAELSNEYTDFTPDAMFVITGIFKTPRPAPRTTVRVFGGELVYLTESGVCAIAASGVLDERCCQTRSGFIDGHLLREDTDDMQMLVHGDFLVISNRRDTLYLLDCKQFSEDSDSPYSALQYEGYIWTGIPAKYMWEKDGLMYFSDGTNIYFFNRGFQANLEYRDKTGKNEYRSIDAYWETPPIYCTDFNIYKFFMRLGLLLRSEYGTDGAQLNTGVKIYAKFDNDDWRVIKDYDGEHCIFRYNNVSYPRFVYSDCPKSYSVYRRLHHKKGRCIKLRFENSNVDEPFTLQGFNVEYIQM